MGLVQQIRSAQLGLGWSVQDLLDKSDLELDRSTLHRKLAGDIPTTDAECEAMARAIRKVRPDFQLTWPKQRAAG